MACGFELERLLFSASRQCSLVETQSWPYVVCGMGLDMVDVALKY